MLRRLLGVTALIAVACAGSEFEARPSGSGASGGSGGSGGVGASGGATGGHGGSGGTGAVGGSGGTGGAAGMSTGGTGGAPSIVVQQTDVQVSTEDLPSIVFPQTPRTGNSVIVGITCFSEVDNCTIPEGGVTDNHGNTYAIAAASESIVSSVTHGARGYIFVAESIAVFTAVTDRFVITADPTGSATTNFQALAWGAIEVKGLGTGSLDQTGSSPVACCEPSTTVSTTEPTLHPTELAVAVHTARSNDANFAYVAEVEWTQHHVNQDGAQSAMPHSMVSRLLSSMDVVSHTWTHNVPTRGTTAIIATFRVADASGF